MKKATANMLLLIMGLFQTSSGQTFGPATADTRAEIHALGTTYDGGIIPVTSSAALGVTYYGQRYRQFYQWNLPDNVIPDGATVSQVQIHFDVSGIYPPSTQMNFKIAKIDYDLNGSTSKSTIFNNADVGGNLLYSNQATVNYVYTGTYGQGSNMAAAIEGALSQDYFTIAIVYSNDQSSSEADWYMPGLAFPNIPLTLSIWVAPQSVTANQVFENDDQITGSTIGHYEGSSFASYTVPVAPFPFELNTTQTFRADSNLWTNSQSSLEKYRTWNNLQDVVNHKDFLVLTDLSNVVSQFKGAKSATIQAQLVDDGSVGGTIDFKDPWLIDTADAKGPKNRGTNARWRSHSSPFNNTTSNTWYKGVFLNQVPDPQDPTKPYYSVGAPFENTINGYVAYFQNWEGNPNEVSYQNASLTQTGVVFKNSGATATAWYKGKLLSSLSNATASNSQRVLGGLPYTQHEDLYVLTYPSAGELWWNISYDNGNYWWYDYRFTNTSGLASAPSLALWTDCTAGSEQSDTGEEEEQAPCHTYLYSVYRQASGNNYNIMFAIPPFPDPGIPTPTQISSTAVSNSINTRPVVTRLDWGGGQQMFSFWEGSGGIRMNNAELHSGTWDWAGEQLLFSGSYKNPSVSGSSAENFFLTYDNSTDVKIIDYIGYIDEAVPASVAPVSFSSQVSVDTRVDPPIAHVVWEASGFGEQGTNRGNTWGKGDYSVIDQHRVMYQQWNDKWEDAHEFHSSTQSVHYMRPTVTNLSSEKVVWAWDDGNSSYKAESEDGGSNWNVSEVYNDLIFPNLVIAGLPGPLASARFATMVNSSAPYSIGFSTETTRPGSSPTASYLSQEYSRRVAVAERPRHRNTSLRNRRHETLLPESVDSSRSFSVEMAGIKLKMSDGSVINVGLTEEGITNGNEHTVWGRLSSQPIMLPENADSVLVEGTVELIGVTDLTDAEISLSFDLIDVDRGNVIKKINNNRTFNENGRGKLRVADRLIGLSGRRVAVRPTVQGFKNGKHFVTSVVHVHTLLDSAANKVKTFSKEQSSSIALPTTFALHQNYPNPFNPSTTIKFDLPEAANVSLVVYDVLGRKVAELIGGIREAGFHSATWNAKDVASGVYFARFTATDANGTVRLNQVNKLLLTK